MHRKLRTLTVLLVAALLVLLAGPISVSAQEGGGVQETFDNPNLEGWEMSPEVTVANGVLTLPPGNFAFRFGDWSDVTLSIKVKLTGQGEAMIGYNMRDEGHYGVFLSEGHIHLEKEENRSPTPLGDADVSAVQQNTWITLKIVQSGGQHQIYIDDELGLTASDPSPLNPGAVLFQSLGEATVEFDDLELRGTQAEGMPPGEGEPPAGEEPPSVQEPQPAEEPFAPPPDTGTAPTTLQTGTGNGGLIEEFFASQASTISLMAFLVNLILAAICAYVLSLVYIHWGSSLTNRRKFAANFMLMTITTTFIILVVRSSIALSLGLVGALSIVRFRTAIKEPEELTYLFFAIGIGIGLGDNQRLITLVAMAAGIILIGLGKFFRRSDADVNLHLSVASHNPVDVPLEQITETLRQHTAKVKLLRFDETSESLETSYMLEFRHMDQLTQARAALRALSPSLEITFMDNKGIW